MSVFREPEDGVHDKDGIFKSGHCPVPGVVAGYYDVNGGTTDSRYFVYHNEVDNGRTAPVSKKCANGERVACGCAFRKDDGSLGLFSHEW